MSMTTRFLMNVMIPMCSWERVHDAHETIALPQPINNSTTAATLKLERNHFILSRQGESYAERNIKECLLCPVKSQLSLCTKPVALVITRDQLCLRALLYDHEVAALKTCVREVTKLPVLPTAAYLGNSIYLLWAADEQQFQMSSRVNGRKSCSVHPACNGKLLHLTNGLVMLPDTAECVDPTGSITSISTPETLDTVFTIPSGPSNKRAADTDVT